MRVVYSCAYKRRAHIMCDAREIFLTLGVHRPFNYRFRDELKGYGKFAGERNPEPLQTTPRFAGMYCMSSRTRSHPSVSQRLTPLPIHCVLSAGKMSRLFSQIAREILHRRKRVN